jgi:hypothetical protein
MEPNLDPERRQPHALLDALPAEKRNVDLAPDTAAALDLARASLARGEGIPHDEFLREFGLKQ